MRGRVGRGGAGSRGVRVGCCVCVGVSGSARVGGVAWSHGADGRSLLLLAGLSLCVRFSPGAPQSPSASCARVPGPPRAWGSTRLARSVPVASCWGDAPWDCASLGLGVCPRLVCGSVEVPAVCFPLDPARVSASGLRPVSVSHKVSAPVCLSPGFSLISNHF